MSDAKSYIKSLFHIQGISIPEGRRDLFDAFVKDEKNIKSVQEILDNQKILMKDWNLIARIEEIKSQSVRIPNAIVGKPYEAFFDYVALGWNDIVFSEFVGLEDSGLAYQNDKHCITGNPSKSGDFKICFRFKLEADPEPSEPHEKYISLIINPDPKSLWKNLESDKSDPHWKEENVQVFEKLGTRNLVVSSKRGRSHANSGGFREDDFAFKHFSDSGWSVVAVSDGAGSAKLSRAGSAIASSEIVDYFSANLQGEVLSELDALLKEHHKGDNPEIQKTLNSFIYNTLGGAALSVHKKLEGFAANSEVAIKDLHATLIFVLIKKYEFGYAILSFGVGDCPIAVLKKDLSGLMLMNWLDVGEFGGGTRFITMPEIFQDENFSTRFGFQLIHDFSYLMLMTDGIYDPKFVVEANLEKIEAWKELLNDLDGVNDTNTKVVFDENNNNIADELSAWMDFWSAGNHDDRTLAIIF